MFPAITQIALSRDIMLHDSKAIIKENIGVFLNKPSNFKAILSLF